MNVKFLLLTMSVLLLAMGTMASAQTLPPAVADALTKAKVPQENVAIIVKEVGAKDALLTLNAANAMNPASVIKLVTTYAGLELLGPTYSWKTDVFSTGNMFGSTLRGIANSAVGRQGCANAARAYIQLYFKRSASESAGLLVRR